MTSITVGTNDLRLALRSVAPHADPSGELPTLHRVRLNVGPVNLTVSATNRYTVGHALVSIEDNHNGDMGIFDLSPQDVKEILALFKGGKDSGDEQPDNTVRLEADDKHTTITDVSGLFDGKSLSLPRYPTDKTFPDVEKLIHASLTKSADAADRLITNGNLLGLFTHAAKAYGEHLVIEPTGTSAVMVITCGESFVGLLMPVKPDEDIVDRINGWHSDWLTRLGDTVTGYATR